MKTIADVLGPRLTGRFNTALYVARSLKTYVPALQDGVKHLREIVVTLSLISELSRTIHEEMDSELAKGLVKHLAKIQQGVSKLGEIVSAIEAVTKLADDVQVEMAAGVGGLAETSEIAQALAYALGNDATLSLNFMNGFMANEPNLFRQALLVATPETRQKALANLEANQLRVLQQEIRKAINDSR